MQSITRMISVASTVSQLESVISLLIDLVELDG